jgi:uncharacterized lipoprotein YehR (DUF1307 family)
MTNNKTKNFNPEKILDDLCLSSSASSSIMFYVRNKMNKEAEKILTDEGLSKKDAQKITEYLYDKYCSAIEIVPIKIDDVDKNDVWKLDDFDAIDVTTYLVKYGNLLEKSKLHEVEKGKFVFYLNNQPPLLLEKVEQLWKIVRQVKV